MMTINASRVTKITYLIQRKMRANSKKQEEEEEDTEEPTEEPTEDNIESFPSFDLL